MLRIQCREMERPPSFGIIQILESSFLQNHTDSVFKSKFCPYQHATQDNYGISFLGPQASSCIQSFLVKELSIV